MKSVYSPLEKAIYPAFMYEDYVSAGTWPADGIEVSDEDAINFSGNNQPAGKELGLVKGSLAWVDLPAPTQAELVSAAASKKQALLDGVNARTQIWQTQLALGIITDADKATLTTWMKYAQAIQAIDPTSAPKIDWPAAPTA